MSLPMDDIDHDASIDDGVDVLFRASRSRREGRPRGHCVLSSRSAPTELKQFFADEQRLNERLQEISSQSRSGCEFIAQLTIRCPNCHQPTQVAADTEFTDLTCNSCGSRFGLMVETQATTGAAPLLTMGRFELVERLGMGAFGTRLEGPR